MKKSASVMSIPFPRQIVHWFFIFSTKYFMELGVVDEVWLLIFANGHTSSNAPDPIWTRKSSGERPGQYWGGGPPGKPLGCCWLFAFGIVGFYSQKMFSRWKRRAARTHRPAQTLSQNGYGVCQESWPTSFLVGCRFAPVAFSTGRHSKGGGCRIDQHRSHVMTHQSFAFY